MDNVCKKCRVSPCRYPLVKEDEHIYTQILLSQLDDHEECVKALLEAGADVNAENSHEAHGTPLVQAASRGHVKRLQALITAGADVNRHYGLMECRDALTDAVARGNIECVKLLIKVGADVKKVGYKEEPLLRFAIEKDNDICADLLIKAGADVNGRHNYSPLCHAVTNKAHRCLDLLLRSGADVHKTAYGLYTDTVLRGVRDVECCRLLLRHHSQINRSNFLTHNALTYHMAHTDPINREVCSLLFAAGETTPEKVISLLKRNEIVNVADYLPQIQLKFDLKHLCRETIRKHLLKLDPHTHLFYRVPRLGLQSLLVEYLLYNMSLDAPGEDDDGNDKDELGGDNYDSDNDIVDDLAMFLT